MAITSRSDRVDVKNTSSNHVIPKAKLTIQTGLVLQSLYAVYSKHGYVVICRKKNYSFNRKCRHTASPFGL
jgi:hypothetical protein